MSATVSEAANAAEKEAPPAPAPPPPPDMSAGKASLYMMSSVLLFLTQGLGMNLAIANITQVQGSLSATSLEAAWLSAAYLAPNVSMAIALVKIRTQYGLRRFAEIGIICFVLVSVLNLFVSDLHSALVVRFISGMAAAPLSTLGFLYMLEAFPPAKKLTIGLSLALLNTTLAAPITRLVSPQLIEYGQWQGLYTLEMAMALIVLPVIYLLPLTPLPRAKVIQFGDIISYLLLAVGFGCLAIFLSMGRLYWWFEAPWLGVLLAIAVVTLTSVVIRELDRETPLIDVRWLVSRENLHFAAVLLVFRLVASEQSTIAANFYQVLGLQYDQTAMLYWIILGASIAGGLFCAALMQPGHTETAHVIALTLIAAGAYMDSDATNLTRPEQMYLSQAMIAAGTALFLPPAMANGFKAALAKGPNYILSFIVIFVFTQSIGALLGSAALGTFVTIREKFHSNILVEQVLLTDPIVAQRVAQLSAVYGKVITDKAILNAEGLALLSQQITREANVLAYNDAFLLLAVIATLALGALLLHLALKRLMQPPADAVASAS